MDDISKMPRLPGDGAQDDSDSHVNESSSVAQFNSSQPIAKTLRSSNNNLQSKQHTDQGLISFQFKIFFARFLYRVPRAVRILLILKFKSF